MAITLKDVALHAGVSTSTVSRACKDHPSISEETKEKIRRAMAELGYEPTPSPTASPTTTLRTIGIVLPASLKEAYENSFYLEAIRGISAFCNEKHYANTIITGNNEEELLSVIQNMHKAGLVDAFILLYSRLDDPIINYLYNEGLLYVLVGKAHQYVNQTIYVDNDNVLAGQEATEYLIKQGHKKIGFIGKDYNFLFSADRKNGYLLALTLNQLPFESKFCLELPESTTSAEEQIIKFLQQKELPTAFVVSDDILAFTLKHVCMELGLSIPEDISIVSFNNSLISRLTSPQLTSMDINSFQLGIEAASQMIDHIENPNLMATKIIVPHQLVERESCKNFLTVK